MKKCVKLVLLVFFVFFLVACAENMNLSESDNKGSTNSNFSQNSINVDDVIEGLELKEKLEEVPKTTTKDSQEVDFDLTVMGSDMVYATVYQMMMEPDMYENKVVKVQGLYNSVWYEPSKQYYQYVLIEDAMACCEQGLEFIWEDDSHIYPDDYPDAGTRVEIIGTFETYKEDGDSNLYCRLNNSSMEIIE